MFADNHEEILLKQLEEIEYDLNEAKRKLAVAKKLCMHAETQVIDFKLVKDNLLESLRVFKNTNPIQPLTLRELEIERFRKDNPEVCAKIRERDSFKENK